MSFGGKPPIFNILVYQILICLTTFLRCGSLNTDTLMTDAMASETTLIIPSHSFTTESFSHMSGMSSESSSSAMSEHTTATPVPPIQSTTSLSELLSPSSEDNGFTSPFVDETSIFSTSSNEYVSSTSTTNEIQSDASSLNINPSTSTGTLVSSSYVASMTESVTADSTDSDLGLSMTSSFDMTMPASTTTTLPSSVLNSNPSEPSILMTSSESGLIQSSEIVDSIPSNLVECIESMETCTTSTASLTFQISSSESKSPVYTSILPTQSSASDLVSSLTVPLSTNNDFETSSISPRPSSILATSSLSSSIDDSPSTIVVSSTSTSIISSASVDSSTTTSGTQIITPSTIAVSSSSSSIIPSVSVTTTTTTSSNTQIITPSTIVVSSITSSIITSASVTTTTTSSSTVTTTPTTPSSETTQPPAPTTPVYSYPTQTPNSDSISFTISFSMVINKNFSEINSSLQQDSLKDNITSALVRFVFSSISGVFEIKFRPGSIIADINTKITQSFIDEENTTLDNLITEVTDNFEYNQNELEDNIPDLDFNSSFDSLMTTKEMLMEDACAVVVVSDDACPESYIYECTGNACVHQCDHAVNPCGENGVCFYDTLEQRTSCRCTTSSFKVYHGARCEDSTATLSFFLAISLGLGAGLVLIFLAIISVLCYRSRNSKDNRNINKDKKGDKSKNRESVRSNEAYYNEVYIPTMTGDDLHKIQTESSKPLCYDNPGYEYVETTAL